MLISEMKHVGPELHATHMKIPTFCGQEIHSGVFLINALMSVYIRWDFYYINRL
mgnify:CR=1 FL=1